MLKVIRLVSSLKYLNLFKKLGLINSGVASPEKLVVLKFGNEAAEGN